tara:strand:+ start:839 stop:1237 length:399 start_codon:yes stop_codon:yes gene_type:complete
MKNIAYKEWVKTLKEGGLVLSIEGRWSAPVLFLSWNGDSSTNGYRSQHLYIPDWDVSHHWYGKQNDPQARVDKQWKDTFDELEKHGAKSRSFNVNTVNARAEERYFPFPVEFLSKNQIKFIKLINKIKGYEY